MVHEWSLAMGGTLDDEVHDVALGSDGSVAVVGYFRNTLFVGPKQLDSAGETDMFVIKLEPDGTVDWAKAFGDGDAQCASDSSVCAAAVGINPQGDVVVAGALSGAIPQLGIASDNPSTHVFVAKLGGGTGGLKWAKRYGDSKEPKDYQGALDLTLNGEGDIFLAGFFMGPLTDLHQGMTAPSGTAGFVAKLEPGGATQWATAIPSGGHLRVRAVQLDVTGDVLVLGDYDGKLTLGLEQGVSSKGDAHSFMLKLADSNGQPIMGRAFGSLGDDWSHSLAVGSQGEAILAGALGGDIDFGGGGVLKKGAADDRYLVAIDSFAKTPIKKPLDTSLPAASEVQNIALATSDDRVVMAGAYRAVLKIGLESLQSAGGSDVFLAQFDANGTPLWQTRYGDSSDNGGQMRIDSNGQGTIVMASTFEGAPDFGGDQLFTNGQLDVFVVKLTLANVP